MDVAPFPNPLPSKEKLSLIYLNGPFAKSFTGSRLLLPFRTRGAGRSTLFGSAMFPFFHGDVTERSAPSLLFETSRFSSSPVEVFPPFFNS